MIGINIGVPAPVAAFPFSGWKKSFYGSLHVNGTDGIEFYTEKKGRDESLVLTVSREITIISIFGGMRREESQDDDGPGDRQVFVGAVRLP